jgi:glycerate-2-kinase
MGAVEAEADAVAVAAGALPDRVLFEVTDTQAASGSSVARIAMRSTPVAESVVLVMPGD